MNIRLNNYCILEYLSLFKILLIQGVFFPIYLLFNYFWTVIFLLSILRIYSYSKILINIYCYGIKSESENTYFIILKLILSVIACIFLIFNISRALIGILLVLINVSNILYKFLLRYKKFLRIKN